MVISNPLFSVLPTFCIIELYPVELGSKLGRSKSVVLDLYRSTEPEIRFSQKAKSIPKFHVAVFSHVNSSLGIALG